MVGHLVGGVGAWGYIFAARKCIGSSHVLPPNTLPVIAHRLRHDNTRLRDQINCWGLGASARLYRRDRRSCTWAGATGLVERGQVWLGQV